MYSASILDYILGLFWAMTAAVAVAVQSLMAAVDVLYYHVM